MAVVLGIVVNPSKIVFFNDSLNFFIPGKKRWFSSGEEQTTRERYVYRYDPETGRGSVEVITETPAGTPTEKRHDDVMAQSSSSQNGDVTFKSNAGDRHSSIISAARSVFDRDRVSPSLNNLCSPSRQELLEGPRPRSSSDSATRFVYRYNPATGKGSVEEVPVNKFHSKTKCHCSPKTQRNQGELSPKNHKILPGFSTPKHPKTHHLLLQPNGKRSHEYTPTKGRGSVELIPSSLSEGPPRISLSQCDLHSLHKQEAKALRKSSPVKPKYVYKYNPSTGRGSVEMIPSGAAGSMPATSRSHGALHTVLETPKVTNCRRPAHMGAKYVYKYNPNSGRGSVEIIPKSGETFGGRRRNHHFNYQSSPLASPQGQGPSYSQHLSSKGQQSPGTPKYGTRPESFTSDKIGTVPKDQGISLSISNLLDGLEENSTEVSQTAAPRPRLNTIGSCPSSLRRGVIQTTVEVHHPSTANRCRGSIDGELARPRIPEERRHSSYDRLTNSDIDSLPPFPDGRTSTGSSAATRHSLQLS